MHPAGSGKTHTIIGPRLSRLVDGSLSAGRAGAQQYSEAEDGLLPRCLAVAFESVQERACQADFTVTASCMELYNENVTDLLGPNRSKQLQVNTPE